MDIRDVKVSAATSKSRLPGLDFALNPYRGCGHGCIYCYSPDVLKESMWEAWGDFVDVKSNAPNLLSRERKRLSGTVGVGTVTDPYQPIEKERNMTRYCLEQLAKADCTVSIQTKSDLVLRDLDILKMMKDPEVGFTITTMDEHLARKLEPGAPPPQRRIAAFKELAANGIRTWAFVGPIIPTLNDSVESLESVIVSLKDAGCQRILYDKLRLKPLVRKRMERALGECAEIFRLANTKEWVEKIYAEVERICCDVGVKCERAF
jgi:DNA repair photolyase